MDKNSKILKILNGRTENSFFIDINKKTIETNKIILYKLYHESLLEKFLDDYFKYRMNSNNYNKKSEYIRALESYKNSFSGNDFEPDEVFYDEDKLKEIYHFKKNELFNAINNFEPKFL